MEAAMLQVSSWPTLGSFFLLNAANQKGEINAIVLIGFLLFPIYGSER